MAEGQSRHKRCYRVASLIDKVGSTYSLSKGKVVAIRPARLQIKREDHTTPQATCLCVIFFSNMYPVTRAHAILINQSFIQSTMASMYKVRVVACPRIARRSGFPKRLSDLNIA